MSELKMMSEFKMSDYFDKPVEFVGDTIECPDFAYATTTCEWEVNGIDYGHAIAHAINHHDKLVEENQRLTAIATKHATVNDERYELLEKQKSDIEKMLDQLFKHEKVDAWLVCKMNDMLDDVNHQLEKSRIEAEKGDGICN